MKGSQSWGGSCVTVRCLYVPCHPCLSNLCSWFSFPHLGQYPGKIPKQFGQFQILTTDPYFQILKMPGQLRENVSQPILHFPPPPSSLMPDPDIETHGEGPSLSPSECFRSSFQSPPAPGPWVWGREEK